MEGEKAAFINGLKNFLSDQSKRFDPHPRLAGKVIDLHDLYYKVTLLGGYRKVSEKELWEDILTEYKLPASSASLCYGLRVVYQRYLLEYERIHFLGDVEVAAKSYSDSSRIRHIPYGSDRDSSWLAAAERGGKSGDKSQRSHYEKLTFALLCCLPNEVDFAINACTLLSGESRHVLRLPNCPQILDALLLHAGILSEGLHSYAEIGEEWRAKSRHDFQQFWADTVDDEYVLGQVFRRRDDADADGASCSSSTRGGHERASRSGYRALLFHSNRALGVQEYEGQRVLQIALVLLNLSFEEFNVTLLARSRSILHFVFLCIHSNYSALRQTGLDILGNLSVHIKLQLLDLGIGVCLYKSLLSCVSSSDKFEILRGFEILGSISHAPANLAHLCVNIEDAMLTTALNLLVLPDIELAVAALEMLYRLTQIGDDLCTRIALIVGSIDILMGLVTLNVRVFGQDKLAKIRLARRIAPVVPDVQKNLNSKAATPGDKSKDPNHHHHQQPRHHAKTPPPSLPTHLRPTTAPRPHYPAPPSIHVRPLARAVSRPSGAGPMYTHSETRVRPPVFHYMPAPPPTIALDGSAESFAKLWIWSTFELSEDGGVGLNRTMLYADYMQSAQQYDMAHKLLSTSQFFTCLQTVFPRCMSRLLVRAEGEPSTYHVSGLRKRQTPFPVPGHQARHDAGAATRPPVPPPPPPVLIRVDSSSQRCGAKIAAGDSQPQRAKCDGENVVTSSSSCNGAKRAIDEPAAARVDNPAKRQKLTPDDDDVTKSASTESAVAVVNGTHFDDESAASPGARCNCPTDKLSATKCAADESLKSGGRTTDKSVMVNGTSSHELVVGRLSSSSSAKPPTSDPKSKTASHDDAPAPVATIHVVTSPSKPSATPPTVNGFWREDGVANSEKSVLSVTTTAVAAATRRETAPLSPTANLKQCHPKQEQTRCNTTTAATANSINHQQPAGNSPPGLPPPSDAAAVPSSSSSSSPADPNVACLVKTSHCESVIRDDNLDRASAPKAIVLDDDSVRHVVRDESPVRGGGDHVMERAVAREAKSIVGHVAAKPIMCDVRAGANFAMRAAAAGEKTNGYFAGCHFTASQPAAAPPPHQPAMHQHHAPMRPQPHSNHTATATAVVAHQQQQAPAVAVDLMAPDASLLILYRNCGKPDFEDFTDRSEDAVSVSIRLTAVLILTNLARYSDVARSMVQRHKPKIATLAMSAMDCSPMLAKLLAALEHER